MGSLEFKYSIVHKESSVSWTFFAIAVSKFKRSKIHPQKIRMISNLKAATNSTPLLLCHSSFNQFYQSVGEGFAKGRSVLPSLLATPHR